jgi:hypothetical protein
MPTVIRFPYCALSYVTDCGTDNSLAALITITFSRNCKSSFAVLFPVKEVYVITFRCQGCVPWANLCDAILLVQL